MIECTDARNSNVFKKQAVTVEAPIAMLSFNIAPWSLCDKAMISTYKMYPNIVGFKNMFL